MVAGTPNLPKPEPAALSVLRRPPQARGGHDTPGAGFPLQAAGNRFSRFPTPTVGQNCITLCAVHLLPPPAGETKIADGFTSPSAVWRSAILLSRMQTHDFASPPRGRFAFLEVVLVQPLEQTLPIMCSCMIQDSCKRFKGFVKPCIR